MSNSVLTVDELGVVVSDSTDHLNGGIVVNGGDAGFVENLGAEFGVRDTESKLLLLG